MCDVVSIIGLSLAVASATGTAVQQSDNQRRTVHYQERVQAATSANAAKAANAQYIATLERVSQARAAAANEAFDAARAADKATASLTVGAEKLGLGSSTTDLRLAIAQKAAQDHAIRTRNMDWQEQQILRSLDGINAQQQSRNNGAVGNPVQGVDYIGLIGRLGSDSLSTYNSYQNRQQAQRNAGVTT